MTVASRVGIREKIRELYERTANCGVVFVFQMRTGKKSLKILLTEKGDSHDTPSRQLHCFPPKHVPTFSSPIARRKKSARSAGVQSDKEAISSFELDREVIRCKTCGLVQYRTRTGNCRRCVRALPQRLEFLIPPQHSGGSRR